MPLLPPSSLTTGFFQTFPTVLPAYSSSDTTSTPNSSLLNADDPVVSRLIALYLPSPAPADIISHLHDFSRLVLDHDVLQHTVNADSSPPTLHPLKTFGQANTSTALRTSPGWRALKTIQTENGVVGHGYPQPPRAPLTATPTVAHNLRIHQFLTLHIWAAASAVTTCPMAMTDGAAVLLRNQLTSDRFLSTDARRVFISAYERLVSNDPAQAWSSGQWMTERSGGSSVIGTETVARPLSDGEIAADAANGRTLDAHDNVLGPWAISGFKWFSSATDADCVVLLARTEKGISAFFAPMRRAVGSFSGRNGSVMNGVQISRLKEKLGTKAGVKMITAILNITRLHTACGSVGGWRAGLAVSRAFTRVRSVQGDKPLSMNVQHVKWMADETVSFRAAANLCFFGVALLGNTEFKGPSIRADDLGLLPAKKEEAEELLRLLTPLMKYSCSLRAVEGLRACMESLGGVGYCENNEDDGILNVAKLFRDANVNPIWEGTGSVMAEDVLRALRVKRKGTAELEGLFGKWLYHVLGRIKDNSKGLFARETRNIEERYLSLKRLLQGKSEQELLWQGRAILELLEAIVSGVLVMADACVDRDEVAVEIAKRSMADVKALKRYEAGVERALGLFDASNEWADYIAFLSRLLKALQASPAGAEIPSKTVLAKYLAQCLRPSLPSGVHQKALEAYGLIFSIIGSKGLASDLPLYFPGFAHTLSFASLSTRPWFLALFDEHILNLSSRPLRSALKAILLSLLPGIEEENNEDFEKTLATVDRVRAIFTNDDIEDVFWQSMFLACVTSSNRRMGVLIYLMRYLPPLGPTSAVENQLKTGPAKHVPISIVTTPEPGLLIRCFATGLQDEQPLVQRGFLDLLVTRFPLNSPIIQEAASPRDIDILFSAALAIVLKRDMGLNRRLWAWFLGNDEKSAPPEEARRVPSQQANGHASWIEQNITGLASPSTYFQSFGQTHVIQVFYNMIARQPEIPSARAKPFRTLVSLMDRAAIGTPVVTNIFQDLLTDLMMYQKGAPSQDAFDEVFRSANVLFDSIDPQMIARYLLDLFRSRKLDLLDFVLLNFALDDEEMLERHIPLIASVMSYDLAKISGESVPALGNVLAKDAEMIATGMGSLLQLLPSQRVGDSIAGQTNECHDDLPERIYQLYETRSASIEVPAAIVLEADTHTLHNVIRGILNSLEHNSLSPVQDLLVLAFNKLYARTNAPQSDTSVRALLDGIAQWSTTSRDLTTLTLGTLGNITSLLVSLVHHTSHSSVSLQQLIVNTVQDLVTKLWANLAPATPQLHVESIDMIWTLHALTSDELVVDSTILSLLSDGLESKQSGDSLTRFATFWILSASVRSSLSGESNGLLLEDRHDGMGLLSRTIVLIIDAAGLDGSPNPYREWLAGLPSLKFHYDVVLSSLSKTNAHITELAATLWRLQTLVSISKSSSVLWKEFRDSSGACQHVISILISLVKQDSTEQLTLTALAIIRAIHENLDSLGDPGLLELISQQLVRTTIQHSQQAAILSTLQSLITLKHSQQPPISLLNILSDGITSPADDSTIDRWIALLCNLLPQYPDAIFFSNLLKLTDCFCNRIQEYFDALKNIYQPGLSDRPAKLGATEHPERSITNLLAGLEYFLARAHTQVAGSVRPTSDQDLTPAEIPQSRTIANNRLTVVLCMQDAIKICGAIWCWRPSKAAAIGGGDTKSFNYLSSKLRARSRRMLEHLTDAEPQECLETLIGLWVQAVKMDAQPRTVMSLLQTLEAARPKFMMPAIFNAVYNRTNPHALDRSQKSTMSINLTGLELLAFLIEYVESLEDDLLEEIWSNCTSFIRDILTNPMPHRQLLLRLIDFASILCQKMENTTFGEQGRMRRELSDLSTRLFTAVFAIKPVGFDSTADPRPTDQIAEREGLVLRRFDAGEGIGIFCQALPMMAPILSEGDRMVTIFSGISTHIIMPMIKAKAFPLGITHQVIRLLLIMSKTSVAAKIWKKDLLEAFNHPSFFDNVYLSDEDGWLMVVKQLVVVEKGLMSELLGRLTAPTTAGIVFGVGAAAARAEADKQTRSNLRRIALVLLAADVDTFVSSLSQMMTRIDELLSAMPSTSPSSATRGDVYLLLRAICLSFTPTNLVTIWPSVNSELRGLFECLGRTEYAMLSTASYLQGAKLLDLLLLLKPEEFQLQEWLFITDTIDAIYPPTNTGNTAAADLLRLDNSQPVELSSGIEGGLRKPLLSTDASRRPEDQRRLLGSFFSHLSIRAFEDTYSLEAIDMQSCKIDILLDLFKALRSPSILAHQPHLFRLRLQRLNNMAARAFVPRLVSASQSLRAPSTAVSRTFRTSASRLQEAATAASVKKPVGAFRAGLFGFLLGSTLAGASVYYYILEEYKVSNEVLSEDIFSLQAAVQRIHSYVLQLEKEVEEKKK
ncbi:hypothetical protein DV736_g3873, partial [Chaetothyriales sp. CBS 134916]